MKRVLLVAMALLLVAISGVVWRNNTMISHVYLYRQDAWVSAVLLLLLLGISVFQPRLSLPDSLPGPKQVLLVATVLFLLLWGGAYFVMYDYPLTRDEHMVVFDGTVYAAGHFAEALPAKWAGYAQSLVPAFLLDVPDNALLISSYAPGNAAMRGVFGLVADPAMLNPLLAAFGFVLLFRLARQFFPDSNGAVWVVMLAYLLSAQVLVNAMTTYAMTAHLALNLAWLALFLRGRWLGHIGAMVIGVWAIGLHQVLFHPLFAGPFILTLVWQRRWWLFLAYAAVYAAALGFWITYPSLVIGHAGIEAEAGSVTSGAGYFVTRVLPLLLNRDGGTLPLMEYNLLRFAAWNFLIALPLLLLTYRLVRKGEGYALPLAGGLVLTCAAVAFIIPYQGHGWGYRYLHGTIGNLALLCGYGYRRWAATDKPRADGAVIVSAGVTALLVLPFLLVTSHVFVKPYALLHEQVERQQTDFVLIDTQPPSNAVDVVRNRADLANRPLVFSSARLDRAQVEELCRRGTIAPLTRQQFHSAGLANDVPVESAEFEALVATISGQPCYRETVP